MNIAEILKQLPFGTKLYSPIFGEVTFKRISLAKYAIIETKSGGFHEFYLDGRYDKNGECMLFPTKDKNWDDFQIPFTQGDIIISEPNDITRFPNIAIFKEYDNDDKLNPMRIYCQFNAMREFIPCEMNVGINKQVWRKANQHEIAGFIKRMNEVGYQFVDNKVIKIVKPEFKVGDIITNGKLTLRIDVVDSKYYIEGYPNVAYRLPISDQHHWKLKKFDVCSLKPYDKVLIKFDGCWYPSLVSYVNSSGTVYTIDQTDGVEYVIPFKDNEHLIGKFDDPDPYYITW